MTIAVDLTPMSGGAENGGARTFAIELIREALAEGRALIGIFHDEAVRDAVATRALPLQPVAAANA